MSVCITGEKILHMALINILAVSDDSPQMLHLTRQALIDYADAVKMSAQPVRWNTPPEGGKPLYTTECTDHPAVRYAGYMEISTLLETSGCSKTEPYWIHSVMGVIDTPYGKLVVCPGDWIVEPIQGHYFILPDAIYRQLYL